MTFNVGNALPLWSVSRLTSSAWTAFIRGSAHKVATAGAEPVA
jgi:hypothetical protein